MTSLKQIEANRRNALKSTGLTTPEGKERSRCNAVRHGLTAETVIAVLERADDYEAFEAALISDYDAETAVQRELVLRLASVLWRLRRATGMETAIFDSITEDSPSLFSAPRRGQPVIFEPKNTIAAGFLRLAAMPPFPLDRLSRYEHRLWRQARQIISTLESLGRRKCESSRIGFPFPFRRPHARCFFPSSNFYNSIDSLLTWSIMKADQEEMPAIAGLGALADALHNITFRSGPVVPVMSAGTISKAMIKAIALDEWRNAFANLRQTFFLQTGR